MAKSIREIKLLTRIVHQAICTTCRYAGPERERRSDAETDAENHVLKPENRNHRVRISTINTRTSIFKLNPRRK